MGADKISPEVSNKLANLSFVCACLVVMLHYPHGDGLAFRAFYSVFPGAFSRMAVPCFFLVSGFLLSCSRDGWWKSALSKRARSLLLPYFVLNLLDAVLTVVRLHLVRHVAYVDLLTVSRIAEMFGVFPNGKIAVGPLWYLRTLFMFVVISPALVWLVRRARYLVGLAIVSLLAAAITDDSMAARYFYCYRGLAYFIMGIWFRRYGIPRIGKGVACFSVALGFVLLAMERLPVVSDFGIALAIIGCWGLVPSDRWPSFFKQSAFPIYVFHPVVITWGWVTLRALGWIERVVSSVSVNLSVLLAVIVFCAGMGYVVRANRWVCALLLGGRK